MTEAMETRETDAAEAVTPLDPATAARIDALMSEMWRYNREKNIVMTEILLRKVTSLGSRDFNHWRGFAHLNGGEERTIDAALEVRSLYAAGIAAQEAGDRAAAALRYRAILKRSPKHSARWNLYLLSVMDQGLPSHVATRIYVCCHRPSDVAADAVTYPIHVGRALAAAPIGFPGDDTGTNISHKNPAYCELTGHYWAWKNDLRSDFIGLEHYRRRFLWQPITDPALSRISRGAIPIYTSDLPPQRPELRDAVLADADIVVPYHWTLPQTLEEQFISTAPVEAVEDFKVIWSLTREVLRRHYPAIAESAEHVLSGKAGHFFNMFVMRRPLFETYSRFLFDILERVETCAVQLGLTGFNMRCPGFLAERLMSTYIRHLAATSDLRIREVPVVQLVDPPSPA